MKSKIISAAIAAFMLTSASTSVTGINSFAAEPPAETSVQVTENTNKADNEKAESKKETEEKDSTEKSEKDKIPLVTTAPANETIQGASKAGSANKADSSKNNADKKAKKSSDDTSSVSETDKSDDYKEQVVSALKSGKGIANKSKDFSSDEHYDTKGNATLIKSEQIIFDSDKMQFISVTTKDGHVFYVLINYTASQGEDNVFFLNKVDDLDLYALLYESDDDSSKMTPEEAKQAAAKASGKTVSEDNSGTDKAEADSSAENPTKKKAVSNKSSMYMLIGILAIGGIDDVGFVLMRKKKGRNGANAVSGSEIQENEENIYDEDDDEFGYDDDDEQDD